MAFGMNPNNDINIFTVMTYHIIFAYEFGGNDKSHAAIL